ncbi:bacteriohemerythrin [Treponema sp. OttesenSCG-928-L16]|nr:bacteriohemerythrin [Treponema sp. OttesenSCG-928-L16]
MSEKAIVEWDSRYSVGIKLIDEQHKGLVDMTNDLFKACLLGDDTARLYFLKTIHKAVEYVRIHFATEEQLMRKIQFPGYAIHRKEHEDFIREVLAEVKNFEEGKHFVPNTFVRYLRDWVLTHIAVSDKEYAKYLIHLKREGRLAGTQE